MSKNAPWPADVSRISSLQSLLRAGTAKTANVPLLGMAALDSEDAAVVLVFDNTGNASKDAGSIKAHAWEEARKIFYLEESCYPNGMATLKALRNPGVTNAQYHMVIQTFFKELLQAGGYTWTQNESYDKEELFLKVSLRKNPQQLREVAEYLRYRLPFRPEAYRSGKSKDIQKGPLRNRLQALCPAYEEYQVGLEEKMEPFRQVDEVRLMMHALSSKAHIQVMKEQGIITDHFSAAHWQDVQSLREGWANPRSSWYFSNHMEISRVRDYFGEQIAFYFAWATAYNEALVPLVGMALVLLFVLYTRNLTENARGMLKDMFALLMVIWASVFNERFKRKTARYRQLWGMDGWDTSQAFTRSSYKPEIEGTAYGKFCKGICKACVVLYIAFFGSLILGITLMGKVLRDDDYTEHLTWIPILVSCLMQACLFIWGSIAGKLVNLENHRTEARYLDSLAWTLASVKLFVTLFPFASTAFLERWLNETCRRESLEAAAVAVYSPIGWPPGTTANKTNTTMDARGLNATISLDFLQTYWQENRERGYCVSGCYPVKCWEVDGTPGCQTNCLAALSQQLFSFYIMQLAGVLAMVLIPIVITKVNVTLEMAKARGDQVSIVNMLCGHQPSKGDAPYSFTEFQAKRHQVAPYKYGSKGGSYTEDFLNGVMSFALLACFGQVLPAMSIAAFVSQMVSYRLQAYRMLNVNGRPWPHGADGIGTWQQILGVVCKLAATCNAALATFVYSPIRHWETDRKFLFFILAQNLLFVVQAFVDWVTEDKPDDVIQIEDFNAKAVKELTPHHAPAAVKATVALPPSERSINCRWEFPC